MSHTSMDTTNNDTRNLVDEFKGKSEIEIIEQLNERGLETQIAIENTLRDFNMGSIVRTANALGIRTVHVVGRKQWNKRGAMMTYKYLTVKYHSSFDELLSYARASGYKIVAIDNVPNSISLSNAPKDPRSILLFGQEGPGLSDDALAIADQIVEIVQRGSTRSINVAAAAAIVMYEWAN